MPFDWMEPKRNPEFEKTQQAKRREMYRSELAERAALLHRLGHARDAVRLRLAANLGWDFAAGPNPVVNGAGAGEPGGAAAIDAVLNAILDREFGGAQPARPKGETK